MELRVIARVVVILQLYQPRTVSIPMTIVTLAGGTDPKGNPDESASAHHNGQPLRKREGRSALIGEWVNRSTILAGVVAAIITTIGYLIAVNSYIDKTVEKIVTKRLTVYEQLALGQSLNLAQDGDGAAAAFGLVLNSPDTTTIRPNVRSLLEDGLLFALTSVERPTEYSAQFTRIHAHIGNLVPRTGWRMTQIGWYLVRADSLAEGQVAFRDAVKLYDLAKDRVAAADAERGLMFSELAAGRPDSAYAHALAAAERNPRGAGLSALLQESDTWSTGKWYEQYLILYGERFPRAVNTFIAKLKIEEAKTRA
jgi:hypothetical protein